MRVKSALHNLIGKIISGVVVAQYPEGNPRCRLYLTFADGTAFELWEDYEGFEMAGSLEDGNVDSIEEMLKRREGAEVVVFRAAHNDPDVPQKDWISGR